MKLSAKEKKIEDQLLDKIINCKEIGEKGCWIDNLGDFWKAMLNKGSVVCPQPSAWTVVPPPKKAKKRKKK